MADHHVEDHDDEEVLQRDQSSLERVSECFRRTALRNLCDDQEPGGDVLLHC